MSLVRINPGKAGLATIIFASALTLSVSVHSLERVVPNPPCTAQGYFKGPDNNAYKTSNGGEYTPPEEGGRYYRCVWSGTQNRFLEYESNCPKGQKFDQTQMKCL